MTFTLIATNIYKDDIQHLPSEIKTNLLNKAHSYLEEDPKHPGLYSEAFEGMREKQIWRSRVDLHYRIAWWYESGNRIILWRVGPHEMIDGLSGTTNFPKVIYPEPILDASNSSSAKQFVPMYRNKTAPGIFSNFPNTHLRLLGIPEIMINGVKKITDIREIYDLGLPDYAIQILECIYTQPEWTLDNLTATHLIFYRSNSQQLESYCKGQTKQLLLDLVPDQQKLVELPTTGPTLIKGVAGSGKTTIGIYRAMEQARRKELFSSQRRILFLTYTEMLMRVVKELLKELYGDQSTIVEVAVIRQWAEEFLKENKSEYHLDNKKANQCLTQAIFETKKVFPESTMHKFGNDFFNTEISDVIKGRNLTTWDAYKDARRIGRGSSLQENQRKYVWEVYTRYANYLRRENIMDYADLPLEVLSNIRGNTSFSTYDEVIIDEAQDLRPIELEMAAALAGGANASGLILLADPKQSIYYRGVSWKDGGVQIAGRRVFTLRRNFRNSKPILEAAWSLIKSDSGTAYDEEVISPDKSNIPGKLPQLILCSSIDQEMSAIKSIILDICEKQYYCPGDIAVLARNKEEVSSIANYIDNAGIPVVHFRDDNFQILENNVKAITINSAKGLDFPVVFLLGINEGALPRKLTLSDQEELLVELSAERQLLYVGMTRACRQLFLVCSKSKKSRFLADIDSRYIQIIDYENS